MRAMRLGGPVVLLCAASLAAGCVGSSRPSKFYTLAPAEVRDGAVPAAADATLAVGPVELPDYLDRKQIVTRAGATELVVADFDRWGGALDREITAALVSTLEGRLAARNMRVVPWRSVGLTPVGSGYRAAVTLSRFDGTLGQSVVLQGRWELFAQRGGKPIAVTDATITEKIDGEGYDALVAAMQRALARFGQQMADTVVASVGPVEAPLSSSESRK